MPFFLLNSFGGKGQIPQQILNQLPSQFRSSVQQGGLAGPGGFGGGQQGALTTWVTQHCKVVPANLWQPASSSSSNGGGGGAGLRGANPLDYCAAAQWCSWEF